MDYTLVNKHKTTYPDVFSIIAGNFNKAGLKQLVPNYNQHAAPEDQILSITAGPLSETSIIPFLTHL